ncbi:MAG: hypothetical protein WAW86_09810 [Gammaproteobacteria bacterium]
MPQEFDISMPIAILDEYLSYRQRTWNSTTERAATLVKDTGKAVHSAGKSVLSYLTFSSSTTSLPLPKEEENVKNRPAICSTLKNRLKNIQSFDDCIIIINEMADQARIAKTQTTVAEESEFSYSLHAARTYFIKQLLNSKFKNDYLEYVQKIKAEINVVEGQIKQLETKRKTEFEHGLSINDTQTEIRSLKAKLIKPFQMLLDLQDKDSIYTAVIEDFFITHKIALPVKDNALIPFKINDNVPLIYHADYDNMYYATRIAKNADRREGFSRVLSQPLKDEEEINLADPTFNHQIRNPLSNMLTSHIDLALLAKAGHSNPALIALVPEPSDASNDKPVSNVVPLVDAVSSVSVAASSNQGLFAPTISNIGEVKPKEAAAASSSEPSKPAPAPKKVAKNK